MPYALVGKSIVYVWGAAHFEVARLVPGPDAEDHATELIEAANKTPAMPGGDETPPAPVKACWTCKHWDGDTAGSASCHRPVVDRITGQIGRRARWCTAEIVPRPENCGPRARYWEPRS